MAMKATHSVDSIESSAMGQKHIYHMNIPMLNVHNVNLNGNRNILCCLSMMICFSNSSTNRRAIHAGTNGLNRHKNRAADRGVIAPQRLIWVRFMLAYLSRRHAMTSLQCAAQSAVKTRGVEEDGDDGMKKNAHH